jgi:hypothetical protein
VDSPTSATISCGGLAESLLARLRAVVCTVVTAKLCRPFPLTSDVTFRSYQVPPVSGPVAATSAPIVGWVSYVIALSTQVLSETPWTRNPTEWLLLANSLSVAELTTPLTPCTLNLRKPFNIGDPSARIWVLVP